MIERFVNKLVDKLYHLEKVSKQEKDLVAFGLVQGSYMVIEIMGIVIIGIGLNLFLECLIILVAFISIRVYAGGYHANTPIQCAIKTWLMYLGCFLAFQYLPLIWWLEVGTMCICGGLILLLAPVQHKNRILDKTEKKEYRKKALRNWFVEVIVFCITWQIDEKINVSKCLTLAMWMVMALLLLGKRNERSEDL